MCGLDIPTLFEADKGYEAPRAVVPVNCAASALFILREDRSTFDLLLTEIDLPDMDGYEFLEKSNSIMSIESNDVATYNCLVRGAMFCVSKPASKNDLEGLWQFAHVKKTDNKRVKILVGQASSQGDNIVDSDLGIVSSLGVGSCGRKSKRSDFKDEGDGESLRKRQRMVWTNELHSKFVEIVTELGIDGKRFTSSFLLMKQIFERMNVPGLKKSNISSHLQKYRLALKEKQESRRKPNSPLMGSTKSLTWGSIPVALQEELRGNDVMHHNEEECYTSSSLRDCQSGVTSEQPSSDDSNASNVGTNFDGVNELQFDGDVDLSLLEDSDFWSDNNSSTLLDTISSRRSASTICKKTSR
ncbi:hypothetical protein RJ641_016861 [Dillenia turbinata]|uniref:Response regulatory domain-containing protein n=1 Tax=Dillenia turbinata TaxID=194707 RepID=A0AAN8USP7_9MAGN